MKRSIRSSIVLGCCLAVAGFGAALGASDEPAGSAPGATDPVYVETAVVRPAAVEAPEAELYVTGMLPTPCHQAAWRVEPAGGEVKVTLWSAPEPDTLCVAALEPVELSIPLGTLDPGTTVVLNGEAVEASPTGDDGAGLVGAGWSFGMCVGYCAADLELDGEAAVLTGRDRESLEPVFVNAGVITAAGAARLARAVAAIGSATLEPVYGCPDCADGGAAYLTLSSPGGKSRHDMEFAAPPEPLAPLYEAAMAITTALESCGPSELVTVAQDCSAYVRPSD